MLCPIRVLGNMATINPEDVIDVTCIEEDCAWWCEQLGKCAIVVDAFLKGIEIERKK